MEVPLYIKQLIDAGIAHYDMDGAVVMNPAFCTGGGHMPAINIQVNTNCGNTYNTYNFYGDHNAMTDIHENHNPKIY